MRAAAWVAASLIGLVALFQVALAAGLPAGAAAWGGNHRGVLPRHLRIASGLAGLVLYPVVGLFLMDAGGILESGMADWEYAPLTAWVLTGLFALGAMANFVSRSRLERFWGPVALGIAIACAIVAAGI